MNGADQGHLTGIRVPDYDGVRVSSSITRLSTESCVESQSRMSPRTTCSVTVALTPTTSPSQLLSSRLRQDPRSPQNGTTVCVYPLVLLAAVLIESIALSGADPSDSADPVDPSHKGELFLIG